ncbi:MAG: hypothetical protein ABJA67_02735 [Chthonomonadales bacterium]
MANRRRAALILECSFSDWMQTVEYEIHNQPEEATEIEPIEAPFTFSHISPALLGIDQGVVIVPRIGVES